MRERVTSGFGSLLIGQKFYASFLRQSGGIVSAKPIAFRHLNKNRSISTVSYNKSNYFSGRYLLSVVIFRVSLALVSGFVEKLSFFNGQNH